MSDAVLPLLPLLLADVPRGLARALDQEGIAHRRHVVGSPTGRFVLFDSQYGVCPALLPKQTPIDVASLRRGFAEDPFAAIEDETAQRCQWTVGDFVVSEHAARFDKRAARFHILRGLRARLEAVGGAWVRIAAFPYPHRSAFCFRLDHDEYIPEDFAAVQLAAAGHERALTHFVSGAAFAQHGDALRRLAGQDVGSHGYWHHTYAEEAANLRNVARGIDALRTHGIEPSGFAAPHGRFNRGLLNVLEQLGVSHSSEFALAFDELPFYPGDAQRVLQVPVHPICLGIALETAGSDPASRRRAAEQVLAHFVAAANEKYRAGEPIFLYGHPDGRLGRYPHILSGVFEAIRGFAALWPTSLTGMACWWRARAAVGWQLFRVGDEFSVVAHSLPPGFKFGIEYCRGEHVAPMALENHLLRFTPTALAYQSRAPRTSGMRIRVDGPESLRDRMRRYLDWEKVTPVGEIDASNWRGFMKRTLRRLRP